jgi:diguanylate cyclase (GGDEF)-like protein
MAWVFSCSISTTWEKFNDTYGHHAGDTVLRETPSFLRRSVGSEDFVCRYGGEEFVIVLPVADLEASEARAKRICATLRELAVFDNGQPVGRVTVSIGIAALPDHGTAPKALLEGGGRGALRWQKSRP